MSSDTENEEKKENSLTRSDSPLSEPTPSSAKKPIPLYIIIALCLVLGGSLAAWLIRGRFILHDTTPASKVQIISLYEGVDTPVEEKQDTQINSVPPIDTITHEQQKLSVEPPSKPTQNNPVSIAASPVPSPPVPVPPAGQTEQNMSLEYNQVLEKLDRQTVQLKTLEDRLHRLELDFATLPLLQSLERSLQKGIPFATTLDVLIGLRPELDIPLLNKYAQKGIPTRGYLAEEGYRLLKSAYKIHLQTIAESTDYGWINFILSQLSAWVDIRPNMPQTGNDRLAILSRIEAALDKRDYDMVLDESEHLDETLKVIFAEWLEKIDDSEQIYREFESLQKSFLRQDQTENEGV